MIRDKLSPAALQDLNHIVAQAQSAPAAPGPSDSVRRLQVSWLVHQLDQSDLDLPALRPTQQLMAGIVDPRVRAELVLGVIERELSSHAVPLRRSAEQASASLRRLLELKPEGLEPGTYERIAAVDDRVGRAISAPPRYSLGLGFAIPAKLVAEHDATGWPTLVDVQPRATCRLERCLDGRWQIAPPKDERWNLEQADEDTLQAIRRGLSDVPLAIQREILAALGAIAEQREAKLRSRERELMGYVTEMFGTPRPVAKVEMGLLQRVLLALGA